MESLEEIILQLHSEFWHAFFSIRLLFVRSIFKQLEDCRASSLEMRGSFSSTNDLEFNTGSLSARFICKIFAQL